MVATPDKKTLKEALDSALDLDQLEAIVKEALVAEREVTVDVEVTCKDPKCGKRQRPRVKVLVPDWNARKNFLQLAIEHSQGRAPQAPAQRKVPSIKGALEELSDEQLLELVTEVPDGETVSSGPEEVAG